MPSAAAAGNRRGHQRAGLLRVQVHITLPKIPLVSYTKAFLDDLAEMWLRGDKLPLRAKVKALSWSNDGGKRFATERSPRRIELARENFSRIPGLHFSIRMQGEDE